MEKVNKILEYELLTIQGYTLSLFNIISLVVIVILARLVVWFLQQVIKKSLQKRLKSTEGKYNSVFQIIKYVIYTLAAFLALESVGINVNTLLIGSAALLVGIGFGLQDMFKDMLSGIVILFEGNIKVGDVIEIEELVGTIKKINLRTCEVETRDSVFIIVPNSRFINEKVINWSHNYKKTRFKINIGVCYGTDPKLVEKVLLECVNQHQDILPNPKAFVKFIDFGSSSLDFQLLFWSRRIWESEVLKSEIRFIIVENFAKHNIQIPFPQLDLHIKSDDTK